MQIVHWIERYISDRVNTSFCNAVDAFGVEMLRVEAGLGQAWLKRQRVLHDPGLIDDPRPPPKRREPSA